MTSAFEAVSFLRRRAGEFLFYTGVTAAALILVTKPRTGVVAAGQVSYLSYGTLILPPFNALRLGNLNVSSDSVDLSIWISDESMFRKMLENEQVYERAQGRLQKSIPGLANLCRSVNIVPLRIYLTPTNPSLENQASLPVVARYVGYDSMLGKAPKKRESDYVNLGASLEEDTGVTGPKVANRIAIQAYALSPRDAQILARVVMETLQDRMIAVASRKASGHRKSIQGYLTAANRKVSRLEKMLATDKGADPEVAQEQERQIGALLSRKRELTQELENLSLVPEDNSGYDKQYGLAALQESIDSLQVEMRRAEKVFLPTSSVVANIRKRIVYLVENATRIRRNLREGKRSELLASVAVKRRELEQVESQLQDLRTSLAPQSRRRAYQEASRQLQRWDDTVSDLETQLLAARLEERLCQGAGTTVVLQTPLPGARQWSAAESFYERYRKTLNLLPLAPVIGLSLVFCRFWFMSLFDIKSRAQFYIDAEVLAVLPSAPKGYRSQWDRFKREGALKP